MCREWPRRGQAVEKIFVAYRNIRRDEDNGKGGGCCHERLKREECQEV